MVENSVDIVHDLLDGDIGVLPGVDDTRSDVLQDGGGDVAGGLIEDVGKVVFRQE